MIKTASGGGENTLVSVVAIKYLQNLLANRTSLRGHPAIINLAGARGSGSKTQQFTLFGLDGYDVMATVAEGEDVTETALTNAAKTITWARKGLRRDISDEMRSLDPSGQLNEMRLAQDGFGSAMVTLTGLLGALTSGFSAQKGSTGVRFTHDLWQLGKKALIDASVPGPYIAALHPKHYSDWMLDLEGRGGLTQWSPAAAEAQILKGPGFQGAYEGIDVYTTDRVAASGDDFVSAMWGRGAVGYVEQEIDYGPDAQIILQAGPIGVEVERKATGGNTRVITNYRVGVTEIEDGRGVGLLAGVG